ncbi:hypothetical protein D3C75_1043780 [compost metagenome]
MVERGQGLISPRARIEFGQLLQPHLFQLMRLLGRFSHLIGPPLLVSDHQAQQSGKGTRQLHHFPFGQAERQRLERVRLAHGSGD